MTIYNLKLSTACCMFFIREAFSSGFFESNFFVLLALWVPSLERRRPKTQPINHR